MITTLEVPACDQWALLFWGPVMRLCSMEGAQGSLGGGGCRRAGKRKGPGGHHPLQGHIRGPKDLPGGPSS